MRHCNCIVFILIILVFCLGDSEAKELSSFEFFGGYSFGNLKNNSDYQLIPLGVSFGWDIRDFAEKLGVSTKGILELQVQVFASPVIGPVENIDTELNIAIKYGFPLTETFFSYVRLGIGPAYITLHTDEQATQFNFSDAVAIGFNWFFDENKAALWEVRGRHLSNLSIKIPNNGIETFSMLFGITTFF